ncbi:MAG: hypothetical protein K2O01_08600, partial [Bacteroidales bacterium]|nr:hypothetical protein [Bacteroidales bacterium]
PAAERYPAKSNEALRPAIENADKEGTRVLEKEETPEPDREMARSVGRTRTTWQGLAVAVGVIVLLLAGWIGLKRLRAKQNA